MPQTHVNPKRPGRADLLPLAVCIVLCVLLAVLPHLLWWGKTGSPVWIADHDDLLYLSLAADAERNHPFYLADILRAEGGDSVYPSLQLVPAVLVARVFSLNPMLIALLLRLWAGFALPLGLYVLLRCFLRRPWVAAALTLALLFDAGLMFAHLLIRQSIISAAIFGGQAQSYLTGFPQIEWHWRIATPAVVLPFVLLFLHLQIRARMEPATRRTILAGISFGLLFYLYFYFWTAVGLALVLAWLLDAGHRRQHLTTVIIGGLIGLPSLIANFLITRRYPVDWQAREDYFLRIPHFSELLLPKLAIVLIVVSFIWIWRRRRELLPLWCLAASGLLLANNQVVTGLQIQNFHWSFIWGPMLSVIVVLLLAPVVAARVPRRGAAAALAIYGALIVGSGFWLRGVEALRTTDSVALTKDYQLYQADRRATPAAAFVPRSVVAGDREFVDLAVIIENVRPLSHYLMDLTPAVTDAEWDTRIALNSWLLGRGRADYERQQRAFLEQNGYGPVGRDHTKIDGRLQTQMAAYDQVAANPEAAMDRFGVRYVALPHAQTPPAYLSAGNWQTIGVGPTWQIWRRGIP